MQADFKTPPAPAIQPQIRRVRGFLERGESALALQAAEALQREAPENRDVLYVLAATQRRAGRVAEAIETLGRLEQLYPPFGAAFEELGFCFRALNSSSTALKAFERAVGLNTCLLDSWEALEGLYRASGQPVEAQTAAIQRARVAGLPPEIRSACSKYFDGDSVLAEELIRRYLAAHGEHVEGLRLLAKIASDAAADHDAELLLQRVLVLAPDYEEARHHLALVLLKRDKHEEASAHATRLLGASPNHRGYRSIAAAATAGTGDFDRAISLYRELLEETPGDPELNIAMGNALKAVGSIQEAIECYRRAAVDRHGFGEASWSLANLKTYRFTDAEIALMQQREARMPQTDRYHLCFALGQALEDRGQFAESFEYYARGNALKKTEVLYEPGALERRARLQMQICTREFFSVRRMFGDESRAPIFIVGLPRSGSTLIEQILASHSQVEGTPEVANIPRLSRELQLSERAAAVGYPGILGELTPRMCRQFGMRYLQATAACRTRKPFFTDRMPDNFWHLDLLQLILPNAKVLDVRRAPTACCFSVFKQLFPARQRFAYSLEDIAGYYRMYVELMAHWQRALPGKILHVQYEDVVHDLDSSVRRILEFCGLEFEPACLEFHRTHRNIHSASSEQVRRPLYKEGVDHWHHFEPWLDPLKRALGPLAAAT